MASTLARLTEAFLLIGADNAGIVELAWSSGLPRLPGPIKDFWWSNTLTLSLGASGGYIRNAKVNIMKRTEWTFLEQLFSRRLVQ